MTPDAVLVATPRAVPRKPPDSAADTGNRRAALWLGAAATVVIVAHMLARPSSVLGEATYLMVSGGAALAAWRGASRLPPAARRIAYPIAAGVTLSAIGDAIYSAVVLTGGSIPDVRSPTWGGSDLT